LKTSALTKIQFLIYAASGFFLFALLVAAIFDPSIRVLHIFQALIYIGIIILVRRNSPWWFGAGCLIAVFWNCFFLREAGPQVWALLTLKNIRPDICLQVAAALAHFVLIAGCLMAFLKRKTERGAWLRFLAGGIFSVIYLILLITIMKPQLLPDLKRVFGL
jgi:hypothetical protein